MRLVPMVPLPALLVLSALLVVLVVVSSRWLLRKGADKGAKAVVARRSLLVLVVVLALAGPTVRVEQGEPVSNVEVYLLVDRTGSMAAEDWNGAEPRLNGVRQDMVAIRDAFPDARFSILSLDSTAARELPLTSDLSAVTSWIEGLHQEITARSTGSSLERGLPLLARTLSRAAENEPGDVRIVYVLSDGEPTDDGAAAQEAADAGLSWELLEPLVDGGAVLGYGTAEGASMREYGGAQDGDGQAPYITDGMTGEVGVSRIDETALQAAATGLGLDYVHRSADEGTQAFTQVEVSTVLGAGEEKRTHVRYVVWPLALVASGLLLWELYSLAVAEGQLRRLAPAMRRRAQ